MGIGLENQGNYQLSVSADKIYIVPPYSKQHLQLCAAVNILNKVQEDSRLHLRQNKQTKRSNSQIISVNSSLHSSWK